MLPDSATDTAQPPLLGLYIEDNAHDIDLTRRALLRNTPVIELDVVFNIADAIKRLTDAPSAYQWVLFDLTLPDGDGLQVLGHIRSQRLTMPAIAVTGSGDERAVAKALAMGVDDYVVKQGDYLADLCRVLLDARARRLQETSRLATAVRVLYIEDNPQDVQLLACHLATHAPHMSMEVVHGTMAELRASISRGDFDVLLLDYKLGDLDAFEIIREMRRGPRRDVPIVVVTGHGAEDTAVQALRLGVAHYIIKDANYIQRLPAVLESAYTRAQLVRERERLRMSEAQLLHLTHQVPGVFLIARWRPDGAPEPLFATEALSSIMSLSLSDLTDGVMRDRIHAEDRGLIKRAIEHAVQLMSLSTCEYRLDCLQRGWRWFETQMTPERQSDGGLMLYSYTFDITERKRLMEVCLAAEAAQRANHAKTEFLSRMSHELRTPLNAILGFAQLLQSDQREVLSSHQHGQVRHIEQAGRHLLEMINEVLDLARIESGHLALSLAAVDIEQACHEALALVGNMAVQMDVDVEIRNLLAKAPCTVWVDPLRLRQVLVNLMSNAIKYNRPCGRVIVSISSPQILGGEEGASEVKDVVVRVSDTGRGLTGDQLGHLFEPFNRLGAEQTVADGTGIGLVIARKLVELMGGRISVRSEVGVGSTFEIALRGVACIEQSAGLVDVPAAPYIEADDSRRPARLVLYAEDNATNVELVRQILLTRADLQLKVAVNGAQAIQMALHHTPDLLLLDMHLGDMDGIAVCEALRTDARTKHIPCVALSADALPTSIDRAIGYGFVDYLTKPLDLKRFLSCLELHLPGRSGGKPN